MIASNILHYNSYLDHVDVNVSMYINVFPDDRAPIREERVRRIMEFYSMDNSIDHENIQKKNDDLIILKNLKPCKKYRLGGIFNIDRLIQPHPVNIFSNVTMDYTVLTGKTIYEK